MKSRQMNKWLIFFSLCVLTGCGSRKEITIPVSFTDPEFVLVQPGTFTMGPSDLKETPAHIATITKRFFIGKREITNSQYAYFLNDIGYVNTPPLRLEHGLKYGLTTRHGKVIIPGEEHEDAYLVESPKMAIQRLKKGFGVVSRRDDEPASNITYYGAVEFCKWLSDRDGSTYRVPTEAEWEYACLEGTLQTQGMPGDVWEWCSDWFGSYSEEETTDP
jgi:formylglycine-generating enzyme